MQHFLAGASWDTDDVRDDLPDYVTGILVIAVLSWSSMRPTI
jgi:hypothetical protein